jgi:hypothetical protein
MRYSDFVVFLGQEYSFPADVYSFSIVLFHLVTGLEAYTGFKDPLQFANQVCCIICICIVYMYLTSEFSFESCANFNLFDF